MSRKAHKYDTYRAISKINSKNLKLRNGNQNISQIETFRVDHFFVGHGVLAQGLSFAL